MICAYMLVMTLAAQIQVGDYLFMIDGKELKGLQNEVIRSLLKGPLGSKVAITVLKKSRQWAPQQIVLSRFPSRTGQSSFLITNQASVAIKTHQAVTTRQH